MVGIHAHAPGGDTTGVASGVDLFITNEAQINNLDELDESKANQRHCTCIYAFSQMVRECFLREAQASTSRRQPNL
jgi:hypothetical protein